MQPEKIFSAAPLSGHSEQPHVSHPRRRFESFRTIRKKAQATDQLINARSDRNWPAEILVEPSRLAWGIWGESEGDITGAYCADKMPKVKTFVHDGHLYTNTGTATRTSTGEEGIDGYPLIPADQYVGPEPRQYTYEGRTVEYKRQSYRLGPRVVFASRARTVAEWTDLLRRMYAHGGYLASGKTYTRVLRDFRSEPTRQVRNERIAIEHELQLEHPPKTQKEMLSLLRYSGGEMRRPTRRINQMELPF